MSLDQLTETLADSAGDLISRLENGEALPNLGLRRAARLPLLVALQARLNRPLLLLTDRTDRALTLADELELWAPHTTQMFFPEPTSLFYEDVPWGDNTRRDRLQVLTSLAIQQIPGTPASPQSPLIVAPARALMARTMPRRDFIKAIRVLKSGQTASPERLARELVEIGYEPVHTVIMPGQFARRGGILDLWPPAETHPARLEFFGDEVDTLRLFDPASQRTLQPTDELVITPAREFIPGKAALELGPEETLSEFHIPLLHSSPASPLDYLPRQAIVAIDNWDYLENTVHDIEEQSMSLRADYLAEQVLAADYPLPYLTWAEIQDSLSVRQTVTLGPVETTFDAGDGKPGFAACFSAEPRFGGQLKPLLDHIQQIQRRQEAIVIVSRQAARLQELWDEQYYKEAQFQPEFIQGSLAEGWSFSPSGSDRPGRLHLLTDGEIFGWRRPEPRRHPRGIAESPEAAYTDLQVGDWVVHVEHGVGRFLGLVDRTIGGVAREYLAVEYAEGDQLFVPVHQADRLTRYVGPDSRDPTPTRLGGVEWGNTKKRVRAAVEEVAEDLLELYSQRQIVTGHAFITDTPWQKELEASFPYIETQDQLRVLAEVKEDMENRRPMDRLICGDVGYGKTEVALRAAFKAVMDGKQVALLVPTTVLAQQHFNTFRERLAAFPVEVEMLSRFRSPAEQREILFRLANGAVDIVIGTHRLLQNDVEFKDLGLLIIDEEQRFGVTHKEFLKQMRTEVDVLTMTATPIPRTLYMALTGVRDISTINTPPEERLPIITHVGPYSKRLIRQAILRELERGGQVFFVHNRVQTISAMRSHLERLVPEARLTVAHGQMPEDQLSERMEQFSAGEVDVLLSTSIIESGLDIPNANTLIVDRADTFGLAQLYQLRGRVGRGAQRAYAYFFKHRQKKPTMEASQRLETIAENTQLGAGFSIAMRDLEIRGMGDILGTRQHGHIAAVGFHLYTRLLADAITRLRADRGLPPDTTATALGINRPLVTVDLPFDVHIPPDYVTDKNMRLRLYRRIANLHSTDEVDALLEEFNDRFGDPPQAVDNLLYQLKVKLLAERDEITSISVEADQIAIRFREGLPIPELPEFGRLVRAGKTALWMPYSGLPDWQSTLLELLRSLQPEEARPKAVAGAAEQRVSA